MVLLAAALGLVLALLAGRDIPGNRAPLVIGSHFNRWSGGGFFDAVERFMAEVCLRPVAVCATHSDVIAWVDLQDPEVLDGWRSMARAHVSNP